MRIRYRISDTIDPEERLEDAAMAKAMADVMGAKIVRDGDAEFGRGRRFGDPSPNIAYWDDPAFLANACRTIEVVDVDGARAAIARHHESGRGAFVKATDLKLFATAVPVGTSICEALGELVYSVLDRGPCIIVQPLCDVKYEMRFVSVWRSVVASSPIAWHLTPASRLGRGWMFETPKSKSPEFRPEVMRELSDLAGAVALECRYESVVIDCAMIDGKPGVVEFNPFKIGNFGLYTCDPHAIVTAFAKQVAKREAAKAQADAAFAKRQLDEAINSNGLTDRGMDWPGTRVELRKLV